MIEIVLDENKDKKFCGKEYPFIGIKKNLKFSYNWHEYKDIAREYIKTYNSETIIIDIKDENFSLNKLSLALFVESIKSETNLQNAVFKVSELNTARKSYYPYVALTIAIKYVLNWINENPKEAYRSMSALSYLNFDIKTNYTKNIMTIKYETALSPSYKIKTKNIYEALVTIGMMKALSLAQSKTTIEAEIELNETSQDIQIDKIVEDIIQKVSPFID